MCLAKRPACASKIALDGLPVVGGNIPRGIQTMCGGHIGASQDTVFLLVCASTRTMCAIS